MTRQVRSQVRANPPRARDPYGVGLVGSSLAPILSAVGLLVVAVVTLSLLGGNLPFGGVSGNGGGNGGDAGRTAAPSNRVEVPDEAAFDGSIVYAKAGNVWIQTDDQVRQLTGSGTASMPSWSKDGEWVYYVETERELGRWPQDGGVVEQIQLDVPTLMRIRADGSGEPEALKNGRIKKGRNTNAFWIRQPVVSPDGAYVAIISDAPNPDETTPVLQLFSFEDEKIASLGLPTDGILGHQDPDWHPNGRYLLYVRNGRDGTRGAPVIMRYDMETQKTRAISSGGYLYPAYSPNGRYIAATRTTPVGTDVVILDGSTGEELLRVTSDGSSWAPTWSPAGDAIAFLHLSGQTVDLRKAVLGGAAPAWTVKETIDLTDVSDLDAASRPDWFIPADQLPTPPPASPSPSTDAAPSATPAT